MGQILAPELVAAQPKQENHPQLMKGRPRGIQNYMSRERREFVEMVVGMKDSPEREAFAKRIREQFMDGSLNPQIAVTIMHWWLGKPKETLEVQATVPDMSQLSDDQLKERALQVVAALNGPIIDVEVSGKETTMNEAHDAAKPAA